MSRATVATKPNANLSSSIDKTLKEAKNLKERIVCVEPSTRKRKIDKQEIHADTTRRSFSSSSSTTSDLSSSESDSEKQNKREQKQKENPVKMSETKTINNSNNSNNSKKHGVQMEDKSPKTKPITVYNDKQRTIKENKSILGDIEVESKELEVHSLDELKIDDEEKTDQKPDNAQTKEKPKEKTSNDLKQLELKNEPKDKQPEKSSDNGQKVLQEMKDELCNLIQNMTEDEIKQTKDFIMKTKDHKKSKPKTDEKSKEEAKPEEQQKQKVTRTSQKTRQSASEKKAEETAEELAKKIIEKKDGKYTKEQLKNMTVESLKRIIDKLNEERGKNNLPKIPKKGRKDDLIESILKHYDEMS